MPLAFKSIRRTLPPLGIKAAKRFEKPLSVVSFSGDLSAANALLDGELAVRASFASGLLADSAALSGSMVVFDAEELEELLLTEGGDGLLLTEGGDSLVLTEPGA